MSKLKQHKMHTMPAMKTPDQSQPLFNSGIAYLIRIDELIKTAHVDYRQSSYESMYKTLESFHVELAFRMIKQDQEVFNKSVELKKKCKVINIETKYITDKSTKYNTNALMDWFMFLCNTAHKLNLIMPDKPSELTSVDYM